MSEVVGVVVELEISGVHVWNFPHFVQQVYFPEKLNIKVPGFFIRGFQQYHLKGKDIGVVPKELFLLNVLFGVKSELVSKP